MTCNCSHCKEIRAWRTRAKVAEAEQARLEKEKVGWKTTHIYLCETVNCNANAATANFEEAEKFRKEKDRLEGELKKETEHWRGVCDNLRRYGDNMAERARSREEIIKDWEERRRRTASWGCPF